MACARRNNQYVLFAFGKFIAEGFQIRWVAFTAPVLPNERENGPANPRLGNQFC